MRAAFALLTLALLLTVAAPVADADPIGDPQCMPVYREYDLGPVVIVQPDSCTTEVYVFGEPLVG